MYKFILGFLFVFADLSVGVEDFQIDVLPDFIGYLILLYGIYRIKKEYGEKADMEAAVKQCMITTGVSALISYVMCIVGMYGLMSKVPAQLQVLFSFVLDLLLLLMVFMYIQLLLSIQGTKNNFQVKRFNMLWKFDMVCIVCQYITIQLEASQMAVTFLFFEKIIETIMLVYMFTSAKTYAQLVNKNVAECKKKSNKNKMK